MRFSGDEFKQTAADYTMPALKWALALMTWGCKAIENAAFIEDFTNAPFLKTSSPCTETESQ